MIHEYKPEGYIIATPENREALSSLSSMTAAMERQTVLEGIPRRCDSDCTLHFDFGGIPGMMLREEVEARRKNEEQKDIAILTRVGKPVCFRIIGFTKDETGRDTAMLSRRIVQEDCYREKISALRTGDILPATVTHLENFGAFCDIGAGIVSLLSIDAISVSRISHPRDRLKTGERIYVVIKAIDDMGRIFTSQRELYGTWEENAALFHAGETVTGIVRSIEPYGIFVELAPNLAGLSELRDGVEVGDTAAVFIKSILEDKMKVKLVIIDTEPSKTAPAKAPYFIDVKTVKHIDYWRYSPQNAAKIIETNFIKSL